MSEVTEIVDNLKAVQISESNVSFRLHLLK